MPGLPTGTVTFLFTDIEGSTRLLEHLKDAYTDVLADCRRLVRMAVQERGGQKVDTEGDAVFAVFPSAREALLAAITAQQRILRHSWPNGASVRVRIGLHTGEARVAEGGYVGMDVHRAARICAAAHGGQILLSDTVSALVAKDLPDGVSLRDLGEHRLKDLAHQHRLFHVMAAELPADFPPIRSLDSLPNNLPRQLTSFIGREKEMAEVKRLLSTAYLVTLTGSGGAGKTRLALQVAADVVEGYPDGVWLAEFAPIADPVLVPKTVASAMNLPEQPGRDMTETLVDALRPKAALLLLDNCEHILAACRDLTATLLRKCPQVRILATSREGLGVPGETLWRIPSLSVPEDLRHLPPPEELVLYDAVRLFVDRATATSPGFSVKTENAPAVAQVCQRLDGIPLAIELAAARVNVLAVEQIAARLDDRFRLLTGGSRAVLPRHQTLGAAIDWSYDLLSETERVMLRRLSVFAGGWTVEAAEAVCAFAGINAPNVLDLLTSLVDKSLVIAETSSREARYRLLKTVRQYGQERLAGSGEAVEIGNRHRDWYLRMVEQAESALRGPQQLAWLDSLEAEHDNLRAALDWSLDAADGAEAGLRLAGELYWFWFIRGHWTEGRAWLERALDRSDEVPASALPKALHAAAFLARRQGDYERAGQLVDKGLPIARRLDDTGLTAWFLIHYGLAALNSGKYDEARGFFEKALALCRESGEPWLISMAINHVGLVARAQGNLQEATALHAEALTLTTGDGTQTAWTLVHAATVWLLRGEPDKAAPLYASVLVERAAGRRETTEAIEGLAQIACERCDYERGARLFGAAEVSGEALGLHRDVRHQALRGKLLTRGRTQLGDAAFATSWAEGRAMTLEQAIEYALAVEAK